MLKKLEKSEYNNYKNSADFYDLDFSGTSYTDIAFYINLLKDFDEILELCCGTGRITIPLAQNKIRVTGIDISLEMLSIFRAKLNRVNEEVANRINLVQASMVNFSLERKFKCILIPFHSFQALTEDLDISQTLTTIFHHLYDDGIFILNLFQPLDNMKVLEGICETKTVRNGMGEVIYDKKCLNTFIDAEKQIIYYELQYYPFGNEIIDKCIVDHLKARYYYLSQITDTLEKHGFQIECVYNGFNFDQDAIDQSSEITLICKRKPVFIKQSP